MSAPFWIAEPDASLWDTLTFQGNGTSISLPGLAQLDLDLKFDVKKNKAQGQDAATVTDRGLEAREIAVTIRIFDPDDWELMQTCIQTLNIGLPGKPKSAWQVVHPWAQVWNLGPVMISGGGFKSPTAADGMLIRLKLIEQAPPKPTVQAPAQTFKQTVGGPNPGQTINGTTIP